MCVPRRTHIQVRRLHCSEMAGSSHRTRLARRLLAWESEIDSGGSRPRNRRRGCASGFRFRWAWFLHCWSKIVKSAVALSAFNFDLIEAVAPHPFAASVRHVIRQRMFWRSVYQRPRSALLADAAVALPAFQTQHLQVVTFQSSGPRLRSLLLHCRSTDWLAALDHFEIPNIILLASSVLQNDNWRHKSVVNVRVGLLSRFW